MKRIVLIILATIVWGSMFGQGNSMWIEKKHSIYNDEAIDSIVYVQFPSEYGNGNYRYEQHVYYKDTVDVFRLDEIEKVLFDRRGVNTEEAVDMGMPSGTKFASCDLGASSPEEIGDYYFYGETKPCMHGDSVLLNGYTRFNTSISGIDSLDAAMHTLGNPWRTPQPEYFEEMVGVPEVYDSMIPYPWDYNHMDIIVCRFNGVEGFLITSLVNGNRLFFPFGKSNYDDVFVSSNGTKLHFDDAIEDSTAYVKFEKISEKPLPSIYFEVTTGYAYLDYKPSFMWWWGGNRLFRGAVEVTSYGKMPNMGITFNNLITRVRPIIPGPNAPKKW